MLFLNIPVNVASCLKLKLIKNYFEKHYVTRTMSALAMFSVQNACAKKLNVLNISKLKSLPNLTLKGFQAIKAAKVFFQVCGFIWIFFRKPKKGQHNPVFLYFR